MKEVKLFKDNLISFGEVSDTDVISFDFKFNDGVNLYDVEYFYPDCGGCTKAEFYPGGVKGTIEVSKASQYTSGQKKPVNKYIMVKPKNGENQFIGNDLLLRVDNPLNGIERLNVAFLVNKK